MTLLFHTLHINLWEEHWSTELQGYVCKIGLVGGSLVLLQSSKSSIDLKMCKN